MWGVVKGQRVLVWTIDGIVQGPTIEVTVGNRVRITLHNQLSTATSIHWHGLDVLSSQDGVPGLGGSNKERSQSSQGHRLPGYLN